MAGKARQDVQNVTYTTREETTLVEDNMPVVFMCSHCRLPVGDSLAWAGSEDEQNHIMLKRITSNVIVGTEPYVSHTQVETGCLIVNLSCRGCSSPLGRVYTSTPKSLDHKRLLYCINVESVDSYVLGSSEQMMDVHPHEKPVTLEYKEHLDQQIQQIKELAVSMAQRLLQIEAQLQNKGE